MVALPEQWVETRREWPFGGGVGVYAETPLGRCCGLAGWGRFGLGGGRPDAEDHPGERPLCLVGRWRAVPDVGRARSTTPAIGLRCCRRCGRRSRSCMRIRWKCRSPGSKSSPARGQFDFSFLDTLLGAGTGAARAPGAAVVRDLEEQRPGLCTRVGKARQRAVSARHQCQGE